MDQLDKSPRLPRISTTLSFEFLQRQSDPRSMDEARPLLCAARSSLVSPAHPTRRHDSLEHLGKLADAFTCCPIVLSKARPCFASPADESSRLSNHVVCRLRIRRLRFDRCHLNRTITSEVRRHAHCAGSTDRCGRCHDNRRHQHAARMQLECIVRSELDYGTDTRVRARRG